MIQTPLSLFVNSITKKRKERYVFLKKFKKLKICKIKLEQNDQKNIYYSENSIVNDEKDYLQMVEKKLYYKYLVI